MIHVLLTLFISSHAPIHASELVATNNYATQRCKEERALITKACTKPMDLSKMVGGNGQCGPNPVLCDFYSDCSGNLASVSISLGNTPATETQPPYLSCSIYSGAKGSGLRQEIATSLGTGILIDVNSERLKTTVTTPDGIVVCTQKKTSTSYDECQKKLKGQNTFAKVSILSNEIMNQLMFKKTTLDQIILAPVPPLRPPRPEDSVSP